MPLTAFLDNVGVSRDADGVRRNWSTDIRGGGILDSDTDGLRGSGVAAFERNPKVRP